MMIALALALCNVDMPITARFKDPWQNEAREFDFTHVVRTNACLAIFPFSYAVCE